MNEIVFVVARAEVGFEAIEPVIDGVSVVELMARVHGEIDYAGFSDIIAAIAYWRKGLTSPPGRLSVLGCSCGDSGCSNVDVDQAVTEDEVIWSDFRGQDRFPDSGDERDIGPFRFHRRAFEQALDAPLRRDAPIRDVHDLEALAAGRPASHDDWLRAMTRAFGGDFASIRAPDRVQDVLRRGLAAFARDGRPMPDEAVRRWGLGRNFSVDAVDRVVERVRKLADE